MNSLPLHFKEIHAKYVNAYPTPQFFSFYRILTFYNVKFTIELYSNNVFEG